MTTSKKTTTKKEMEEQLKEAKSELQRVREEKEAMAAGSKIDDPKMVPVRNFGGTELFVPYEINGIKRTAIFAASGPKASGALPYEVWLNLEYEKVVESGHLARTDMPITNPNIIEDIEDFFSSSSEKEIKEKLNQVENRTILYACYSHMIQTPKESRSAKQHAAMVALIARIEEVAKISLTEEDIG